MAGDDELTFTVTAREIYDAVRRLEAKLDTLPTADHEDRLRMLESTVARLKWFGGGSVGTALVAAVGALVKAKGVG